jgi:hypothetical protein
MRFRRHYLLSLEERLGVHFSAGDSDYDHRKRDDRLTTAQKEENMVNLGKNRSKSLSYRIAHILGRGFECPNPPYPTSLDPSSPPKFPQVSWKSLTVLDGNLTGEAAVSMRLKRPCLA